MSTTPVGEHAVVLGASMAGLLAARVLSESFTRVTVVDRDEFPPDGATTPRRGVPQGHHPHTLLPRGQVILEDLFPGLRDRLVGRGAVVGDVSRMRFLLAGRRMVRAPGPRPLLLASRPLLETEVRAGLLARSGVTLRGGCDVDGYVFEDDRVTGVRVRPRDRSGAGNAAPAPVETVGADLVVDATGRGSRTPALLVESGRSAPPEESVTVEVAYTSGRFRFAPGALDGDLAVLLSPAPGVPRGGAVFAVEGDEHVVGLSGAFGETAPTDPDAFLAYARTLPFTDIAEALAGAVPTGPLRTARFRADAWRRYDRVPDLPGGLLVVGDAVCAVNPVYGQGMTVAALQAVELRRLLAAGTVPEPRTFARAAARVIAPAWMLTVGADRQDPRCGGAPPGHARRLVSAYVGRFQEAGTVDVGLATAFREVTALLAPPVALLRPDRVARVLWVTRRRPVRS